MTTSRLRPTWRFALPLSPLLILLAPQGAAASLGLDDKLPAAFAKPVPENVNDLKEIQAHVKTVISKVMPTVVNLKIGPGQGSGVIVSEDGLILTAAHVSLEPGKDCLITFPDGKTVKGKSLGRNTQIDAGMVKISGNGKYPFSEMGNSADLKKGEWCLCIGHPGGYKDGRSPPVRVGRILGSGPAIIRTDCVLVGGDSGGPLFDMHGKVIGINSRISFSINENIHVPVDTYRETWARLTKGEQWPAPAAMARLGLQADPDAKICKVTAVDSGSAADKAGLKVDDVIVSVNGKSIGPLEQLQSEIRSRKPGDEVILVVRRGDAMLTFKAVLEKAN